MILFSPAKINLGLRVLERRSDGFHDIETVMWLTGLCDILEIRAEEAPGGVVRFTQSGIQLEQGSGTNLCIRAYELYRQETPLPAISIHLHKQIPVGAGLGGGSSNATFTLMGLNQLSGTPLEEKTLHEMAARLGSDCPFFLHRDPMLARGRGEILSPLELPLNDYYLALLHPGIHISTAEAYSGITPDRSGTGLSELLMQPPDQWRKNVINDFEGPLFRRYPVLERMKTELYGAGALYASLSGSGSALYGIFAGTPELPGSLAGSLIWKGRF